MNLLWLLLIPAGLFTGCSIGIGFFKLSDYFDVLDEWWYFPLWMVVGLCVVAPIIFGSIAIAIALVIAGVQVF
jgi:hypothetical protein